MATTNFSSGNRIIFISDESLEFGDIPNLSETEFRFFELYLEDGYYEGAKIDFKEKPDLIDTININPYYYDEENFEDFTNACIDEFFEFLTDEDIKTVCDSWFTEGCQKFNKIEDFFEDCLEILIEKAMDVEKVKVNEHLDKILSDYGYSELKKIGTFSNGSGIYEKIN